jgi:hypothetical protein
MWMLSALVFWEFYFVAFLSGCQQNVALIERPNLLKEKGIGLGDGKPNVVKALGVPHSELNFRKSGQQVSILEYDSWQIASSLGYERDDVGILSPRPGIQERHRRDYRLVFIDDRLCSIEDFVHGYYTARPDPDEEAVSILESIRKSR